MKSREAFELLGVTPDTPLKEVRRQYHRLIRENHPDGSTGNPERATRIIEAYQHIRTRAVERITLTAPQVFVLGQEAVHGGNAQMRLVAVRQLGRSAMQSAVVFLRQALFDHDEAVALAAARGLVTCGGLRCEDTLLGVFDDLSEAQRVAVIQAVKTRRTTMKRLLSYALADPSMRVRHIAQQIDTPGETHHD